MEGKITLTRALLFHKQKYGSVQIGKTWHIRSLNQSCHFRVRTLHPSYNYPERNWVDYVFWPQIANKSQINQFS